VKRIRVGRAPASDQASAFAAAAATDSWRLSAGSFETLSEIIVDEARADLRH
jgi:hypothetical protein